MKNYCFTLFPCFSFGVFDHGLFFKFFFSFVVQSCIFFCTCFRFGMFISVLGFAFLFYFLVVFFCFGFAVSFFFALRQPKKRETFFALCFLLLFVASGAINYRARIGIHFYAWCTKNSTRKEIRSFHNTENSYCTTLKRTMHNINNIIT